MKHTRRSQQLLNKQKQFNPTNSYVYTYVAWTLYHETVPIDRCTCWKRASYVILFICESVRLSCLCRHCRFRATPSTFSDKKISGKTTSLSPSLWSSIGAFTTSLWAIKLNLFLNLLLLHLALINFNFKGILGLASFLMLPNFKSRT